MSQVYKIRMLAWNECIKNDGNNDNKNLSSCKLIIFMDVAWERNLENLGGGGGKQDFFEKLWSHISSQGKQRKATREKAVLIRLLLLHIFCFLL